MANNQHGCYTLRLKGHTLNLSISLLSSRYQIYHRAIAVSTFFTPCSSIFVNRTSLLVRPVSARDVLQMTPVCLFSREHFVYPLYKETSHRHKWKSELNPQSVVFQCNVLTIMLSGSRDYLWSHTRKLMCIQSLTFHIGQAALFYVTDLVV